jgi:large subunit ribosomal protein L19
MAKTADQRKIISPVNVDKRQEINIQTGDTVRVVEKIPEGDDFRLQPFEGIVLSQKHGNEPGATFTVRQEVEGVGVEKIFPLYTPQIDEISIIRRARTRRSKLYHIRDKAARQIRREMRRMVNVNISTRTDENEEDEEGEEGEDAVEGSQDEDEPEDVESQDSADSKEETEADAKQDDES